MEVKDKTFAPVIIPTLNRYEHLKRCLDSLERCKDAEFTDVFIGLDYPPSEAYVDGWEKINAYLKEKERSHGFSHLIIKRREKNLGAVKNYTELRKDVFKYGFFIFTEDDNEFSPCFLNYMNQNLRLYEDDKSIFRVCGYLPYNYDFRTNYSQFKATRHIAWGIGEWVDKYKDFNEFVESDSLLKIVKDKKVQDYFEEDKLDSILVSIVRMSRNKKILEDVIVAAYLVYKDMRCILPTQSMVRNHGQDGSGLHSGISLDYMNQAIQENRDYLMNEAPLAFTEDFEHTMRDARKKRKRSLKYIKDFFTWRVYKYLGIFISF